LKNIIKNAVVIKEKDILNKILPPGRIRLKSLNYSSGNSSGYSPSETQKPSTSKSSTSMGLAEKLLEFERKNLKQSLARFDSTRDMADDLGISQSTVVRKLKKHGLSSHGLSSD
jgi:TyrR family helix-turn-helix protein